MEHDQLMDLVPLYALDALDGAELTEFESHLETCQACAAELAVHQSVTAGFTPDEPAPTHAWDRIAKEISESGAPAEVETLSERRRARDWRLTLVASVAALAALVLGVVAIFQAVEMNELSGPEGVVAAAEAAADEPGAIVADLDSPTGTLARIVLSADGEGFVVPADLETLEDDRTYQLWVITPGETAISAGVLGNEPAPARFTWTGDVAGFALTREVAGGVVSSAGDVVSVVEL